MEDGFVRTNGIRMHYVAKGQGSLVVFLHGFPEFWYSWRYQLPAIAEAGYRAVAPDLRGWGLTEKPRGVKSYQITELLKDILGLVRALGYEKAHVVGHDWGGVLTWCFAHRYSETTLSMVATNSPHPKGFLQVLKTRPLQWWMSKYALFFQIPWLPEELFLLRGESGIRNIFGKRVCPEAFNEADINRYSQNALNPDAIKSGINYYRALFRSLSFVFPRKLNPLQVPALVIWGDRDPYLLKINAESARPWVPAMRIHHIRDAGHWVQVERPELVNSYIIDFLSENKSSGLPT